MRLFIYIIIIFSLLLSSINLLADNHGHNISGTILNESSKPIISATVRIANTTIGTKTDKNGYFSIKNIPHGEYTILFSAVGYQRVHRTISLSEGENHDFAMEVKLMNAPINFENIVVTATRSSKIYEDVPVKTSVIENRIFEATASATLYEGLSFQPGLRVENNCQNCGFTAVRLNGLEGQYTQILINSRPVFSALAGVYGLEQIPTNMIDRVEVIRGGGSALYGSSAVGGVVNVITKDPTQNSFSAGVMQSYMEGEVPDNYTFVNGTIVNDAQNTGLSFFGNFRSRNPWDANGDGFSEISKLEMNNFGGDFFYKPGIYSRLGVSFNAIQDNRRGGNGFELPPHQTDITEMANHKIYSGDINYEQYLGKKKNLKISTYTSLRHIHRDSYYGAEQDPSAYGNTENNTFVLGGLFNYVLDNALLGDHIITAGYEFRYDDINDEAISYNRNIKQLTRENGFYLQDDWTPSDKISLVLGARVDDHNLMDNPIISPRANAMYKVMDNLNIRANFSTGFRAPQAFNEDLHITQVGGEGLLIRIDEDLEHERSISFGISADYSFNFLNIPFAVSAEYFNTQLNNVFVLEEAASDEFGNTIMLRTNGDGANVSGVVTEIQSRRVNMYDIKAGFTYENALYDSPIQWSEDPSVDRLERLPRSPNWYGYMNFGLLSIPRFDINLSAKLTGPMQVPHFLSEVEEGLQDELIESETFFELDFNVGFVILENPNLIINAGVVNVLNSFQSNFDTGITRDAAFIYGPLRPRTMFVGLKTNI